MDYQTNYDYFYNKTFTIAENLVKSYLQQSKNQHKTVNYVSNTFLKKLNEFVAAKFNYLNKKPFQEIYQTFKRRYEIYEKDQLNQISKNELQSLLLQKSNTGSYSLMKLIYSFAQYDALNEISRLMNNNYQLFDLMYRLNDFSKFKIEDYHTLLENLSLYKKLYSKVHPIKKSSKQFKTTTTTNKNNEKVDSYLNVHEVAELTGYAVATIYDKKHKGEIPFHKLGAKLVFKKSEILQWMDKHKGTTNEDLQNFANEYLAKNEIFN